VTASLRGENLIKQYGANQAVRGVSISVSPGEVVGLLGPNGAGKTTTFNMVVGRVHPTSGRVLLGDEDITGLAMYLRARRGITYLPQEPSVFRKLTVEQNVLAILETLPLTRQERYERLQVLLGELSLTDLAKQKAATLSGGERRRVEITRALVLNPSFMLLDEPFSGIDPIAVTEIQKIVHGLKSRSIGIVITDHNVRETLSICDRAYIIQEGTIIREGTPDSITEDPRVREVYLGQDFRM
jgi:lipopolysaccharide export system ATP-binding protein